MLFETRIIQPLGQSIDELCETACRRDEGDLPGNELGLGRPGRRHHNDLRCVEAGKRGTRRRRLRDRDEQREADEHDDGEPQQLGAPGRLQIATQDNVTGPLRWADA